jgi:hypothetical protein
MIFVNDLEDYYYGQAELKEKVQVERKSSIFESNFLSGWAICVVQF